MKMKFSRLSLPWIRIAAFAAVAALLGILPACQREPAPSDTDIDMTTDFLETAAPAPAELELASGGKSDYIIVRAEEAEQAVIDAAVGLRSAFVAAGIDVQISTDWEKKGADPALRPEKEILVGATNREESRVVSEKLRYDDYTVGVVGEKLVICGGGGEATAAAAAAFAAKYLAAPTDSLSLSRSEVLLDYTGQYAVTSLTVGGADAREFVIGYTHSDYKDAALALQSGIIKASGLVVPVMAWDKAMDSGSRLMAVGMPDDSAVYAPCTGQMIEQLDESSTKHAIEQKDGRLFLAGRTRWTAGDAVNEFLQTYLTGKSGEVSVGDISLLSDMVLAAPIYAEADLRVMTLNTYGTNGDYEARFPYAVSLVKRYMPDVIGMQEVNKTTHNHVVDELSEFYGVSVKWHDNGSTVNYTPILYRKDKYTVVASAVEFLDSRYTGTNTKSITWAVFEPIGGGERFGVINLHGALIADSYNIPGSNAVEGAAWRVDNVRQMLEIAGSLRTKYGETLPVLFTGDFNFNIDSEAYAKVIAGGMKDAEFTALVSAVTGTKTTHTVGQKPAAGKSIDHVFYTPDAVEVYVHSIVLDDEAMLATDHCAVYADVRLKK